MERPQCTGNSLLNICQICGKEVEVINNDIQFSIELHVQSHKKLSDINSLMSAGLKKQNNSNALHKTDPEYLCSICNDTFVIINNDIELSLQLHSENHKHNDLKNCWKTNMLSERKEVMIIDKYFDSLPANLKNHWNFLICSDKDEVYCKVCNFKILEFSNTSIHLKTKVHENNILSKLNDMLPSNLHHTLEFLTFYESNLWCNLCNCKITLSSNNLYETIFNIIVHNSCDIHKKYIYKMKSNDKNNEAHFTLMNIAKTNPLININLDFVDYKMPVHVGCRLCAEDICFYENSKQFICNFTTHLESFVHKKRFNAFSVIRAFETAHISLNNHNFTVSDYGILCSSCNSMVEENVEKLISHIKVNNCYKNICLSVNTHDSEEHPIPNMDEQKMINLPINDIKLNHQPLNIKAMPTYIIPSQQQTKSLSKSAHKTNKENSLKSPIMSINIEKILNTLPKEINSSCIVNETPGQCKCKICNCIIPLSTYNLQTHLSGLKHRKKEDAAVKNLTNNVSLDHNEGDRPCLAAKPKRKKRAKKANKNLLSSQKLKTATKDLEVILSKFSNHYDHSCIHVNQDGQAMCIICDCTIPMNSHDIQTHLSETEHSSNKKEENIISLFKKIPNYLEGNRKYITFAPNLPKSLHCSLCDVLILFDDKSLEEHLVGIKHKKACKKLSQHEDNKGQTIKINKTGCTMKEDANCSTATNVLNVNGNVSLNSAVERDLRIKDSIKYLRFEGDHYACFVCKAIIIRSNDEAIFKKNLLDHFDGMRHKTNISKLIKNEQATTDLSCMSVSTSQQGQFQDISNDDIPRKLNNIPDEIFTRVLDLDPIIKKNKKYLIQLNNVLHCLLCICSFPHTVQEKYLKPILTLHFLSNMHKENLKESS